VYIPQEKTVKKYTATHLPISIGGGPVLTVRSVLILLGRFINVLFLESIHVIIRRIVDG
jgi:hypothetical protein